MGSVPLSYTGRGSIHVHGGLLYRGDSLPDTERFEEWADRLEDEAATYLEGLGETELRPVFHLVMNRDEKPRYEIHAEMQVLLGAR